VADNPKAYDQAFKSLSDADPRGLLDIFGVLPHGVEAEVEPLPRDIASRRLVVDTGYFVRPARGKAFIALFEALTSWEREIGRRLASYGAALGERYRMPIRIYALPMAKHACPARTPAFGRAQWGDVLVAARLHWIKPWEIDAGIVLKQNSPRLDPWAVLFQMTRVQEDEIIERVKQRPQEAGLVRMLGGMRYRRNVSEWNEFAGRLNHMISREKMRESLAVQEWLAEGRQEGRQEGWQEGRREGGVQEAREALLSVIETRFPSLHLQASVESISDIEILKGLLPVVVKAASSAAVLRAIRDPQKAIQQKGRTR
jgi:hypothetical protein